MQSQILTISEIILTVETALFSFCFLLLAVPKTEALHNYRICRKFIAFAYLILAVLNVFDLLVETSPVSDLYISLYISLIISSFQASLVTYALITLINKDYIKRKTVFIAVIPTSLFALWFIVLLLINSASALKFSYYIFIVFYIVQIGYLALEFYKQLRSYRQKLNDYFSEQDSKRLQWILVAFFSALTIGILALLTLMFPGYYSSLILCYSCIVFYFYYAINYLNYLYLFHFIEPIAREDFPETEKESPLPRKDLSKAIDLWIERKGFTMQGITINDVARDLNTNRTYLSTYINTQKGISFSEWINQLRIEEAQRLLIEQPHLPIVEISEAVGYAYLSSFGRQFSKIAGSGPVSWRRDRL